MANNEINDLTNKTTPVSTDEVEIQETAGGLSKKATVGNLAKGMSYNDLNDKPTIPSGDVTGPASSTDNAIPRFDGTGGKTLQASTASVTDTGTLESAGNILAASGTIQAGAGMLTDSVGEWTPAAGVTVDGVLIKDGEVDGRDVSVDGTKLDGIESNATADQTGAEIKTAYEAEANTNAFTDAEQTKLSGIETGADVTDTANVTAAGALMDSEVDADIKTLSLPANTTISTFGASLIDDASNTAARTTLGLGTAATLASIDEDDMTSNSATALPTQQSVKAYVDALAGLGGIDSQSTSASSGYIRFKSGIQIAWKGATAGATNNAYGSIYYGDATMGNWAVAFDAVLVAWATNSSSTTVWALCAGVTTTSAGSGRIFRPTSTTAGYPIDVIAIGTWS